MKGVIVCILGTVILFLVRSASSHCDSLTGLRDAKCTTKSRWVTTRYRACGWLWRKRCTVRKTYWNKVTYYSCKVRCRVNGGWNNWHSWGSWCYCKRKSGYSCIGYQTRRRYRLCNNPRPKNGGRCYGSSRQIDTRSCLLKVNGKWSNWGSWDSVGSCSKTCGEGLRLMTRERSCSNPRPKCGGHYCYGTTHKYRMKSCSLPKC